MAEKIAARKAVLIISIKIPFKVKYNEALAATEDYKGFFSVTSRQTRKTRDSWRGPVPSVIRLPHQYSE